MSHNEVRVFVSVPEDQSPEELETAWSVLDGKERSRAERFAFPQDRLTFVVAHGLLRLTLARHTGLHPREIQFSTTAHGRPYLVAPVGSPEVCFSLSHARGLIGCALTVAADVGLDIERLRVPAPLEVAESHFSSDELIALRALPRTQRPDRFYALWTLKEAYLKGRGLGLTVPLDRFSINPSPDGRARIARNDDVDDSGLWTFQHWRYLAHRAAVAVRSHPGSMTVAIFPEQRIESLVAGRPPEGSDRG